MSVDPIVSVKLALQQHDAETEFLPEGLFAIISWDPVACVASFHEEEATRQARLLPRRKYLAVVGGVRNQL